MRLFISVQLNKVLRDQLLDIQEGMREQGVQGNFTRAANLHITLAFIGEYSDPEDVREVMEQVEFDAFALTLDGVGAFGNLWWAGIGSEGESDGTNALKSVAKRLRRALSDAGIPFDRKKFSPHITLVRKAQSIDGGIPSGVLENVPEADMIVDRISLMRSDRGKHGMIYTEL